MVAGVVELEVSAAALRTLRALPGSVLVWVGWDVFVSVLTDALVVALAEVVSLVDAAVDVGSDVSALLELLSPAEEAAF